MKRSVGLFGGSFNPIHFGHLIIARAIREKAGLDEVIFLPSRKPPHKPLTGLADAAHRAEMVRRAIEGEAGFTFDDYDLTHKEPCYTFDTVSHFRAQPGKREISWIIGGDSLVELPTWHRATELVQSCTILTADRAGTGVDWTVLETTFSPEPARMLRGGMIPTPIIDISSTDIRQRVREGRSIRFLVPEAVHTYIAEHGLYK